MKHRNAAQDRLAAQTGDPLIPRTKLSSAFGCLPYDGPAKTIEEMNAGVLAEARRRWERFNSAVSREEDVATGSHR